LFEGQKYELIRNDEINLSILKDFNTQLRADCGDAGNRKAGYS